MRTWRIDTALQSLALASDGGIPQAVYWGPPLPPDEDPGELARAAALDLSGGMLDRLAPLSLTPEPSRGFQGQPGLALAAADGAPLAPPPFALVEAEATPGRLRFVSAAAGLRLIHEIAAEPTGVLTLPFIFRDVAHSHRVVDGPVGEEIARCCRRRNRAD